MYKVKANEELFNKWRDLGLKISSLANIVQNDYQSLSEETLEEWDNLSYECQKELDEIATQTYYYIVKNKQ